MHSRSFELVTDPLYGAKGGRAPRNDFFGLGTTGIGTLCAQGLQSERFDGLFASTRALHIFDGLSSSFQVLHCGVSSCNGFCCVSFSLVVLRSEAFLVEKFLLLSPAQPHEGFRDCGRFSHEVSPSPPLLL
jgi:hypothetical protein